MNKKYEQHKNFYLIPTIIQFLLAIIIIIFHNIFLISFKTSIYYSVIIIIFFLKNLYKSMNYENLYKKLKPFYISTDYLKPDKKKLYIGKGFNWSQDIVQKFRLHQYPNNSDSKDIAAGNSVLHMLGYQNEKDLHLNTSELNGHTCVVGTTRVGKTRFFEIATTAAIKRGESVIIVDPKGDNELVNRIYSESKKAGRKTDFRFFSLIHPELSHSMNPIGTYLKPTDIASRIVSIMPQDGSNKPFIDFCLGVLVDVINAMELASIPINLKNINRYTLTEMNLLLKKLNYKYDYDFNQVLNKRANEPNYTPPLIKDNNITETNQIIDKVQLLNKRITHPGDHFSKMIGSLTPIMSVLNDGEIGDLLSSDKSDMNWQDILENKRIVYFYLGAMVDPKLSSYISRFLIQDLLFYIGMCYSSNQKNVPCNLFIDEVYNVVYDGIVNILNKAGGAGLRCTIAMQTTSDIESVLEAAQAQQILGNTNTKIIMRVTEKKIAEECSELWGMTKIKTIMHTKAITPNVDQTEFSSNIGERLIDEDAYYVRPYDIMKLPKGQAFIYDQGREPLKVRFPLFSNKPEYDFMKTITSYKIEDQDPEILEIFNKIERV